jgi:hypothetical protein
MSAPKRNPRIGDIVLFHESVHDGIWGHTHTVALPAIVTEIIAEHEGAAAAGPRLRLTAFCPFDKPKWDISAHFSEEPKPGCWTWPDATDRPS